MVPVTTKSGLKRWDSAPSLEEMDITISLSNKGEVIEKSTIITDNERQADTEVAGIKEHEQSDDENDTKTKYRRCSSLKSGKTPPGSPNKRKIVRYECDLLSLYLSYAPNIN